jgi:hypothetical protein
MTASPLAFPTSRHLAGWRRQVPLQAEPLGIWAGYLELHCLEALAVVTQTRTLPPLDRFLLALLNSESLGECAGEPGLIATAPRSATRMASLADHLGLPCHLLQSVLRSLAEQGLIKRDGIAPDSSISDEPGWTATSIGLKASTSGQVEQSSYDRRAFTFVGRLNDLASLRYLQIDGKNLATLGDEPTVNPVPAQAKAYFETLARCIQQPEDWKQRHGFPGEVSGILLPEDSRPQESPSGPVPPAWRRVLVARREYLFVLLLSVAERLIGFAAQPEKWILQVSHPCINLSEQTAREVFPDMMEVSSPQQWRGAWQSWGQSRGLPIDELQSCELLPSGSTLLVRGPLSLIDRIRQVHPDALKSETWIMGSDELLRPCARLVIQQG